MIGPSYILGLPNELYIVIPGLFLTGLAGSFTAISAYSEMCDPFVDEHPHCDGERLSDVLSGLYNAGFSLGAIIGPVAGSYITIASGSFRVCSDVFAGVTLLYCLVLLMAVYYPSVKTTMQGRDRSRYL